MTRERLRFAYARIIIIIIIFRQRDDIVIEGGPKFLFVLHNPVDKVCATPV